MGHITLKAICCDFCDKHQFEVAHLIAGPSCFICDECVDLCTNVISEWREANGVAAPHSAPHTASEPKSDASSQEPEGPPQAPEIEHRDTRA